MALYEIVGICAYLKDGRVVRHRRPGAIVDLNEETAARLGAAVKPKRRTPPKPRDTELSIPAAENTKADGGEE